MANKKLNKGFVASCVVGVLGLGGFFATVITGILKESDIHKLADANGYQEANAIYRQVEIDKLNEQLYSMEITPEEHASKIEKIKDLSVYYYLSNNVSQQVKEEYSALKADTKVCTGFVYASTVLYATGSISALGFFINNNEEQEKNEGGSQKLTEKMTKLNNEQ